MPIAELVIAVSGKAAGAAIGPLLRDLIEVQDRQTKALEALHADVRKLVDGPRRRARTALENAIPAQGARQRELLQEVSTALGQAHSYEEKPSATRAAVGAEMAFVTGLLGYDDEARRWTERAHEDARASVTSEIPVLTRAMNKRGNAASWTVDFFRDSGKHQYGFWSLLTEFDKYDKALVDREIWLTAFLRTFRDGVEYVHPMTDEEHLAALGLPAGNKAAEWACLLANVAQRTVPGAQLMRLHRLAADSEDYRQARAHLCGDTSLPVERLRVDVSAPFRARLEWGPSVAR